MNEQQIKEQIKNVFEEIYGKDYVERIKLKTERLENYNKKKIELYSRPRWRFSRKLFCFALAIIVIIFILYPYNFVHDIFVNISAMLFLISFLIAFLDSNIEF